jgi:hypothetical protein
VCAPYLKLFCTTKYLSGIEGESQVLMLDNDCRVVWTQFKMDADARCNEGVRDLFLLPLESLCFLLRDSHDKDCHEEIKQHLVAQKVIQNAL